VHRYIQFGLYVLRYFKFITYRGNEKQIEKNKRRAARLYKKVEALRKVDLEQICSQFSELTDPPSTEAIEQALLETIKLEMNPSSCLTDQHNSGYATSQINCA